MAQDAYLEENGTDKYLLEDGTGVYLLEQQGVVVTTPLTAAWFGCGTPAGLGRLTR